MKTGRAVMIANVILSGALVAVAAALVYAIYRSSSYTPGTLNRYYVLLGAGLVLLALALKLPAGPKENAALVLLSVVVSLYMFESILACCMTVPEAAQLRLRAARNAQIPYDTRSRYEVYSADNEAGHAVVPSVGAGQLVSLPDISDDNGAGFLPLGGVSARVTLHCNETGAYTYYQADEFGFNNPLGLHTGGAVVLLGDSFAHGNCVPPGDDIASQLRARQWPVVNVGYSGSGPLIELASLREYGVPLKPATVLWFYYEGNDLDDLQVEAKNALLLEYLRGDFSQRLRERQPEIDRLLDAYVRQRAVDLAGTQTGGWRNTPVARIARLQHLRDWVQLLARPKQRPPSSLELLTEILTAADATTTAEGGRLYFVYLPSWRRLALPATEDSARERELILDLVHTLGIPVIDLTDTFQQHPDPLSLFPFRVEGHYTAEGYGLAAATIDTRLTALGVSR